MSLGIARSLSTNKAKADLPRAGGHAVGAPHLHHPILTQRHPGRDPVERRCDRPDAPNRQTTMLFEIREFDPLMRDVASRAVEAAAQTLKAIPLLGEIVTNAGAINAYAGSRHASRRQGGPPVRRGHTGPLPSPQGNNPMGLSSSDRRSLEKAFATVIGMPKPLALNLARKNSERFSVLRIKTDPGSSSIKTGINALLRVVLIRTRLRWSRH
jgi:hypothetical protein